MRKKGFTIVELLIVISVIAILATITINSYQATRKTTELSTAVDTLLTDLRELKLKTNEKCRGIHIENHKITIVTSEYLNPITKCGLPDTVKQYEPKDLKITQIKLENEDGKRNKITILFVPPDGEIFVPQTDLLNTVNAKENVILTVELDGKVSSKQININRKNGTIWQL